MRWTRRRHSCRKTLIRQRMDRVTELIEGYEDPVGRLLSSVRVMCHNPDAMLSPGGCQRRAGMERPQTPHAQTRAIDQGVATPISKGWAPKRRFSAVARTDGPRLPDQLVSNRPLVCLPTGWQTLSAMEETPGATGTLGRETKGEWYWPPGCARHLFG